MRRDEERRRRKARRAALEALYAGDVGHVDPLCVLDDKAGASAPDQYSVLLVEGVTANRDVLDARIEAVAEHWRLERMPPVDRAILRMALYEMEACEDVPVGATINEAVELAKCYSTTESGRFVNGLLGRLAGR